MPIEIDKKTGVAFVGEDADSIDPKSTDWLVKRVDVDPKNAVYCSIDGVLYSKDLKTLVRVPCYYEGELSIPSGVVTIGKSACRKCAFEKIVLPDSAVKIDADAFYMCLKLKEADIGVGIKSIGNNAFAHCQKLKTLVFPETLKTIGSNAFAECESLKSVQLPRGLTKIGAGAFSRCFSIDSITIPDGIASIESKTFEWSCLKSIQLPPNLRSIGKSAFENGRFAAIDLPKSLKSIGNNAFAYCETLRSLVLPRGIESIDEGAFYYCKSLTKIELTRDDGPFSIRDGCLLGDNGETFLWFPMKDPRRRHVVPDGVKKIGAQAFGAIQGRNASNLEEVVLPDGLESIGREAFTDCYRLEDVVLPESVKFIGEHAFRGCAIKELVIPDGIEKICRWAFNYCYDLALRGSKDSYAEEYAAKNKIPFKPL